MGIFYLALTTLGLSLFEIITSLDNAIINAEVLSKMQKKNQQWFLLWGFLFAVVVVRGILPLLIVYLSNPQIGLWGALTATFSGDPGVAHQIEQSSPFILIGGGIFLIFLFFHWLFLEQKSFGLYGERFFFRQGVWFFALVSVILSAVVWIALKIHPLMAFGAVVGSTAFFITHGFREYAEKSEESLIKGSNAMSDISKLLYLEVLDATFSIDGVVGAFAFTFSVPLIFLGNGIGAYILRKITISNINRIKDYKYLKNGAMYSILILGLIMLLDSFGAEIPPYLAPVTTFVVVGYFYWKSKVSMKDSSGVAK